jgi:hypothetical protein
MRIPTRTGSTLPRRQSCRRRGLAPRRRATAVEPLSRDFSTRGDLAAKFTGQPPSKGAVGRGSSRPPETAGFVEEQRCPPGLPLLVRSGCLVRRSRDARSGRKAAMLGRPDRMPSGHVNGSSDPMRAVAWMRGTSRSAAGGGGAKPCLSNRPAAAPRGALHQPREVRLQLTLSELVDERLETASDDHPTRNSPAIGAARRPADPSTRRVAVAERDRRWSTRR